MSRRHPIRRIGRVLLLAGIGLTLALGAFELVLRAVDPYSYADDDAVLKFATELRDSRPIAPALSSFYLRPGAHIEFLGEDFDINERGYRTPMVDYEKPDDVYRIVVVGDSVPFGWGVAESACFPRRLETLLNERERPFGRARVEVVNLSGPGRGLGDYLIVFEHEALKYHPDFVIVPLVFNDVPLMEVIPPDQRPKGPGLLPPWLHWSWSARFVHLLLAKASGAELHGDYWIGIRTSAAALAVFPLAFDAFAKVAAGTPMLLFDMIGERPGHGVAEIAAAATQVGIPRVECFLDLEEWSDRWAIHAPKHNHPNPAAHERYAQVLLGWFEQHGL